MTTAEKLLREVADRGMALEPADCGVLWVHYDKETGLDPAFKRRLKRNKPALMKLLRSLRHLALQVVAGEFNGCDYATAQALMDALVENQLDPRCSAAIERLMDKAIKKR